MQDYDTRELSGRGFGKQMERAIIKIGDCPIFPNNNVRKMEHII